MNDDIFQALQDELTADTDSVGVPESAWFWDSTLTRVADAYAEGQIAGNTHLEMRGTDEPSEPGTVRLTEQLTPFDVVAHDSDSTSALVGKSTSRDLSIVPLTLQIFSDEKAYIIPSWVGVTRGGQRWVRLGGQDQRQLINLDEVAQDDSPDPIRHSLDFASRIQQIHMGVQLPDPEFSPLDLLTAIAVSQAARVSSQPSLPQDLFSAGAERALRAQVIMRVASIRALLNLSHGVDALPVAALARLDALSDQLDHLGCGHPAHSPKILSPGATAVLTTSLREVAEVDWSDIDVEALTGITGMDSDEAHWWGPRGVAEYCKHRTGGVSQVWSELSDQVGPFLGSLLSDAERTGLSGPVPA